MLRGLAASPGRASSAAAAVLLPLLSGRAPPPLLVVPARGRKTRHDPPAKSKEGRISQRPPIDPAEQLVIRERYRLYDQTVRALRAVFQEDIERQERQMFREVQEENEEKEHCLLMEWNDAENRRLQARRVERFRQEEEAEKERLAQVAKHRAAQREEFMKEREKEVLQLQEEAKNFITPENLDARIEECLDKTKNYNFAIDKKGRIAKQSAFS